MQLRSVLFRGVHPIPYITMFGSTEYANQVEFWEVVIKLDRHLDNPLQPLRKSSDDQLQGSQQPLGLVRVFGASDDIKSDGWWGLRPRRGAVLTTPHFTGQVSPLRIHRIKAGQLASALSKFG